MQHKQHNISTKCDQHGLIYMKNGCICYPIVETKKGEKIQTWQLQIQCFSKTGDQIQIDQDNCDDILLSNDIKSAHIIINQISTCGKKHVQKSPIVVESGKNLGKKNQTTIVQQSLVICDRKYENMIKKKHSDTQIQTILPMLLSTYAYAKLNDSEVTFKCKDIEINFPVYIQRKLDGLRCVAVNCNLFSRGQKQFTNLTAIQSQIETLNAYLENKYKKIRINIDGELYLHGKNLQEMNRIIRNGNADTKDLIYNIFDVDCIDINQNIQAPVIFNDRMQILQYMREIIDQNGLVNLRVIDTFIAETDIDLQHMFKQFVQEGFEGIVVRNPEGLYEYSLNGKRSKDVLRCKPRRDLDVQVVGFCEGNGKDTGAIIWICEHQNKQFNVVQNASLDSRTQQFKYLKQNQEVFQIIKKMPLQIEYNEESEDGLPLQPRAIIFRQDKTCEQTEQIHQLLAQFGLI